MKIRVLYDVASQRDTSLYAGLGMPGPPFRVVGEVQLPTTFDLSKLQSLPVTNQNVTYFASGSVVSQTFTGASLWDVLSSVGIILNPNIKNDILTKIIRASDHAAFHLFNFRFRFRVARALRGKYYRRQSSAFISSWPPRWRFPLAQAIHRRDPDLEAAGYLANVG